MIAVDLRTSSGRDITPRVAAVWTGIWVSLSLAFAGVLYSLGGTRAAVPFLTAYVIEYALSVDNLFVFMVIFSFFKLNSRAQHRLLYWGIIGAFILRGTLIGFGTLLVSMFTPLLYVFGAILLFTAYKLLFSGDDDDQVDPEKNAVFAWARRNLPVAQGEYGLQFLARENGRLMVTSLFLVLLVVETSDLLFALDSIPAVLAISHDPFIVFSSNACAILGLRSLFFLVESLIERFRYLKVGLGVILAFVGLKLILETAFESWVQQHEAIAILASLAFIAVTLAITIVASMVNPPPPEKSEPAADPVEKKTHV